MTEDVTKDGVEINTVEATQIDLLPGQSALVFSDNESILYFPGMKDEDYVPQHTMFLIGIYFRSEDQAFVEMTIRYAIDRLKKAREEIEKEKTDD